MLFNKTGLVKTFLDYFLFKKYILENNGKEAYLQYEIDLSDMVITNYER